jgi:hypothetical protein
MVGIEIQSWKTYPLSLDLQVCDPYEFNLQAYKDRWDLDAERIFEDESSTRLKIIEIGHKGS